MCKWVDEGNLSSAAGASTQVVSNCCTVVVFVVVTTVFMPSPCGPCGWQGLGKLSDSLSPLKNPF